MKDRTVYIYFIQQGFGAIKVGMAKDPDKRLRTMQTGTSKVLRLLAAFPLPDRQSARTLEYELHKLFECERIKGEWFNRRIVRKGRMSEIFGGTLKRPFLREKYRDTAGSALLHHPADNIEGQQYEQTDV